MLEPMEPRVLLSAENLLSTENLGFGFNRSNPRAEAAEVLDILNQQQIQQAFTAKQTKKSVVASLAATTPTTASTIPANGDLNPYGTAFVPNGFAKDGILKPGDLLVSNFNNADNLQGTGTTIIRVTPDGQTSTFFQGSEDLGLTTALTVLKKGFVIVGNLPTLDGTGETAQPGSLIVLDKNGNLVTTLAASSLIHGPWDMAVHDKGSNATLFVSNALDGTVTRLTLKLTDSSVTLKSATDIASGYTHRTDPSALLLGPTGLAFDAKSNKLYVASTADNAIYMIKQATKRQDDGGTGKIVIQNSQYLHGPLGMVLAPNGNLIVSNGDAINPNPNQTSSIVEFTKSGKFISQHSIDPASGAAFGIAIHSSDDGPIRFAAVNDDLNTVSIWTLPRKR